MEAYNLRHFQSSSLIQIKPFMDGLSIAINTSNAFDPKEIDYTLKIAYLQWYFLVCLAHFFKDIRAQAPNAKLNIPWSSSSVSGRYTKR
ncbi:hypothetical protein O9929_03255 [Vibrio lentus]|nr:hypothetical protein [Vibrio lentus]